METLDLVVIGAGFFGLSVAKTYHQLHPDRSLTIIDANADVGGVWTSERLYPGLKTNNLKGTYEFPDYPMDPETFGIEPGQYMTGDAMHNYLLGFAEKFDIHRRIRFNTQVLTAEHQAGLEGGWTLTVRNKLDNTEKKISARKLIVATGMTSEPFLPHFDGQEEFEVPLFHGKDFLQYANTLSSAHSATVFGGTKSAWDAVYAYASRGIKVNWVIRASGHGPAWMSPSWVTPLKKWLEKLPHTRLLTWFSPCVWGDADGYTTIRRFYHETAVGRAIVNGFWWALGNDVKGLNNYDSHSEVKKLTPWSNPMFTASSFSILNFPTNFFDLLKNGTVNVHIADIVRLSPHKVHLSNGTQLKTDVLCCATGWKHIPPLKFLPEGIEKELGLPHIPSDDDSEEPVWKSELVHRADQEILTRFPRLKDQPIQNKNLKPITETKGVSATDKMSDPATPLTPFTLYRLTVPPSARFLRTRDIAFAGFLMSFSTIPIAPIQSLWICAYMDDELSTKVVPSPKSLLDNNVDSSNEGGKTMEEIRYETVLYSRFGKWRYPAGHGAQFPDFIFDAQPYMDMLIADLGLKVHRKKGMLAEWLEPYGIEDYPAWWPSGQL